MKLIEAHDQTLLDYYTNTGILNIPYTQRPYTWEKENIDRIFKDFTSVNTSDKGKIHIMNFFTLYEAIDENGNKSHYIYDGQQRTITMLIIISEILYKLEKMLENEPDQSFASKLTSNLSLFRDRYLYTVDPDLRSNKKNWKINFETNEMANKAFQSVILNDNYNEDKKGDFVKQFFINQRIIKQMLNEYIEDNNLDIIKLHDFLLNIEKRILLVVMKTKSEEIAETMFESLNNTGKKVETYYVLRNTCLTNVDENEKKKWNQIDVNLDQIDKSDFLKSVATLYNGKTTYNQVLPTFEKLELYNTENSTIGFISKLSDLSYHYLSIRRPNLLSDKDFSTTKELLENLEVFGVKQHYPIILALFSKNYSDDNISKVLNSILKIVIRNIFILQRRANSVEGLFGSIAHEIFMNNGEISEIIHILNNEVESDEIVKTHLKERTFTSRPDQNKLKFILEKLYNIEYENELLLNTDTSRMWLEHILPQSPDSQSQWLKDFNTDDLSFYTYCLGNATLLIDEKNKDATNFDFLEKVHIYKNSNLHQNKDIATNSKWTADEIIKRTCDLSTQIINKW